MKFQWMKQLVVLQTSKLEIALNDTSISINDF